ncbi:hydrolase Cof [Suicoccus acidiformans]|uniref:Hydrolase Cof n=1 Tax=Suicoccus acidiformans TaxID=2036206 RepID=A0A347WMQ7_9LACT|nr:HAD family hydrolase [Suicoccus acidiformans]AXY26364.1 hydrolase Cof [Suicoccus acidiformans]
MSLKLVMIDLDGTLLTEEKTYDRERFDEVVEALVADDIIVCIATGNSYHKVTDYFDETIRPSLYFACDNGNYIVKNGEMLHEFAMSKELMQEVVAELDRHPGYHPLANTGPMAYFREREGEAYENVAFYNNNLTLVDSFDEIPEDEFAVKFAIYSEHDLDAMKEMIEHLNATLSGIQAVTSGFGWLDVYVEGGGKGAAAHYLMEKYNIQATEAMAFGDSLNDLSMMQEVRYSIAMADADQDLSKHCRYQIGSNEDQAVITTLETYIQKGNLAFLEAYQREAE